MRSAIAYTDSPEQGDPMSTRAPKASLRNLIINLRLVRLRLFRQYNFLRQGRLDEALDLMETFADQTHTLPDLDLIAGDSAEAIQARNLVADCRHWNDAILPFLLREQDLLAREHLETQVDRELLRLNRTY